MAAWWSLCRRSRTGVTVRQLEEPLGGATHVAEVVQRLSLRDQCLENLTRIHRPLGEEQARRPVVNELGPRQSCQNRLELGELQPAGKLERPARHKFRDLPR